MRELLGKTLAFLLLLVAGRQFFAQAAWAEEAKPADAKPILTVAFSGYDAMMDNIRSVGELAGRPQWTQIVQGAIALGTQGKGLKGLDKERPWGLMVFAGENDDFPIQAFVPVTDLKPLMKAVPGPDGPLKPDDDGVYEISAGNKTFYAAQKGKWARVTDSRDGLKTALEDPLPLMGDLAKKYLVSARLSCKSLYANVPQATRDKFMPLLKFMFESNMPQQSFDEVEAFVKQVDDITLGLGFDATTNTIFFDSEIRALPGTRLAEYFENAKKAKSNFASFHMHDAAVTAAAAGVASDEQAATTKARLKTFKETVIKDIDDHDELSKDQQKVGKELADEAFEVLDKTVDLKKTDIGLKIDMGDPSDKGFVLVGGSILADGLKLEAVIKKLAAEIIKDHPEQAKTIKLDAETYEGLNFHVFTVPVNEADAAKILGKTTDVAIAINDSKVYFAGGKEPVAAIKKVIEESKKNPELPVVPIDICIALTQVAKYAAFTADEDDMKEKVGKFAEELAKSPGKDHVKIVSKPIPQGGGLRISVEPGVIKAIGGITPGGPAAE